jgi:NADH dehydrogenase
LAAWRPRALADAAVDVTLLDKTNHHLFQPLLYQVATAGLSAPAIAGPVRHLFRKQANVLSLMGEVVDIDAPANQICLADGARLGYDHLIVAAGASHSYFGHDEWAPFAPGLKTLEDAFDIRRRILFAFEAAEREEDPVRRAHKLNFVVVGGGPTGVEMAGTMAEIARQTLQGEFRRIDPATARVMLLEGGPRVLQTMPEGLSERARQQLMRLGVEVRLNARVTHIDATGLQAESPSGFNGGAMHSYRLDSQCVIWAAGVAASPLGAVLKARTGCALDRAGRVLVQPDLTLEGHANISVIGDLAAAKSYRTGQEPRPVPGVSPAAKQMGRLAAANVLRRMAGFKARPFSLHRLRQPGHHRPQLRRGGPGVAIGAGALQRLLCLAVLAVCPHLFPDRLSQPAGCAAGLGLGVLELPALCAGGGRRRPAAVRHLRGAGPGSQAALRPVWLSK